nr:oxidoreductase [Raoultella sp. NCTC 9187]
MDLVAAKGKSARVIALNDYTTIVPIDDFHKFPVILALKMNGEYMRVRDKGPLFIVYPYDSSPDLQNQIYYSDRRGRLRKLLSSNSLSRQA